jgi:NADPH-dependent glutamate synthase beta subunit-like oxidoreductase
MPSVAAPKNLDKCLRGAPAACTGACWFGLDVRDFIGKLKLGNFGAAFDLYRNTVVFPGIVSRLCDAPCAGACVLKERARGSGAPPAGAGGEGVCF